MRKRAPNYRRQRGITMIETLVATAIVTVAIAGSVSIFMSASTLSANTTEATGAAMLARRTIEECKNRGFASLVDGTTNTYYDVNGLNPAATVYPAARFKVVTVVSTDIFDNGVPAQTALRTVTVTVKRKTDDKTLETTGTFFAWGGP